MKNKTIFIQDSFTGEVLFQMIIKENMSIPFSFHCHFKTLQNKIDSVVAKQWIQGDEKTTILFR